MPNKNKSKASPAENKEARSSSPNKFLIPEVPKQKNKKAQSAGSPSNLVDVDGFISALDDLTGNLTAEAELQRERSPVGEPPAKRRKLERTQESGGPSSEPLDRTNDEMAETEVVSSSTSVGEEDGPCHVCKPEDI
ncbi:uncharacterized protein LOC6550315 [Drosophila erecta]|nr:uncharacterized protein LOC6550315 [Drosophila erecta]